jgi:hypothetical protein
MRLVASEHSVRVGQVLGYLIAHEVAHVLMVNEGHDDSGLMRSDWAKKELRDLQNGRLRFEFPKRIQQSAQEWIENRYRTAAGVDARF